MDLDKALEILESLKSQVEKRYGREFGSKISPRGLYKHKEVRNNEVEELIAAAKRNLPDEEKNSMDAIDREANRIEARRNNTKNKVGAYKADLHTIGYGGKLRSPLELDDNRREDAKKGYPRAIEKSIKRHDKKVGLKEALEILESFLVEGDNLAHTVYRYAKKHKMNTRKAKRLRAKALQVPSHNDTWYDKEGYIAGKQGNIGKGTSKRDSGDYDNTRSQELKRSMGYKLSGNQYRDEKAGFPVATQKSIDRHARKMNKSEALSLVEEMLSLANSIFEETPQAPETEGVPPSNNKIKQTKKSKETNKPTEVVSVADELFPYEGNAKEQMNQKILAKINDMIEGTATLEDLLQLVRKNTKKPVAVKEGFDRAEAVLEEIINEISKNYTDKAEGKANYTSQKLLVRSGLAAMDGDKVAAEYHRKEFDKAQNKIKDFHKKAEKHFEVMKKKKEDNAKS